MQTVIPVLVTGIHISAGARLAEKIPRLHDAPAETKMEFPYRSTGRGRARTGNDYCALLLTMMSRVIEFEFAPMLVPTGTANR